MRPFRVLHVSNMNINNPTAPAVDESFLEELSLWAPDAVVLTGDLVEAGAPIGAAHWEEVLDAFRGLGGPLIVLCGNHDPVEPYRRRFGPRTFYARVGPIGFLAAHNWIRAPLADNSEEKGAFLEALKGAARDGPEATLLLCHENAFALDAVFEETAELLRKARAGLLLSGSHRERELDSRAPLRLPRSGIPYLCTHEGSTTRRSRATGLPHYRVLDCVGESPPPAYRHRTVLRGFACVYDVEEPLGPGPGQTLMRSIPSGMVRAISAQDGTTLFVQNSLDMVVLAARAILVSPVDEPYAMGGRIVSKSTRDEKTVCEVEFDAPPRAWKTVALLPGKPPYEVELDAPEALTFGESCEIAVSVTNARDEVVTDVFALSLGGDYLRRRVELAPRETKRVTFGFRPRGRRARTDAAVFYSSRERLTWERPVELVPPGKIESAEWIVEPGVETELSLSLELEPNVAGARVEVLLDDGSRGSSPAERGRNAVELGTLAPGSGDGLARVWLAWKGGSELLALLPLRVAWANGGEWHGLVEDVTGREVGSPGRFRVREEAGALVLDVRVAEPWPDGVVTGARPDASAEKRPPLWKDDGIEWFLADSVTRVHVLANGAGLFEVEADDETKGLIEGRAKVKAEGQAWRIELPDVFEPGTLRMNVCRNRVVEGLTERHAWSPTRGDAHEKEFWGHLVRVGTM